MQTMRDDACREDGCVPARAGDAIGGSEPDGLLVHACAAPRAVIPHAQTPAGVSCRHPWDGRQPRDGWDAVEHPSVVVVEVADKVKRAVPAGVFKLDPEQLVVRRGGQLGGARGLRAEHL